jgi:multimeric flavodoxin WrbA
MEGMKVVVIKGSPRKFGNTAALADQVAEGARARGAQVESFYLHGMDIQPCDACDSCQGGPEVGCIIDDDMQILYPKLREADGIAIASPVYWFNVSAQTKIFIDRLYAMAGEIATEHALSGKRFGVIMVGEDKDPFETGAINGLRAFQDMFRYIDAEMVGYVFGSAGDPEEIRKDTAVMAEAFALGERLASESP